MVLICDDIWGNIISFHPLGVPIPSITFHTGVYTPTGVNTPACDVAAPLGLRVYASYGDTHSPTSTQGVAHGLYMFKPFRLISTVLKESLTLNS